MDGEARYRSVRRLGEGAAGGVELVEDALVGGPPVALKRLRVGSDARFASTFAEEFAVLASLSLPGVARVLDLGAEPDGQGGLRPYLTREFIDGVPLDQALAGAEPERVLRGFAAVLQVVAPLHRAGVIHRDLKPANIIVDPGGQPHLIDFGLARRLARAGEAEVAGTPAYMAPELLRGEPPSMASDVYALGATLWELLTGRLPFDEHGGNAMAVKLRGEVPALPGEPTGVRRGALEVCQWALAHDARDRAANVEELAAALGRVCESARLSGAVPFVAPRPEGRGDLVARVLTRVRHNRRHGTSELCVLTGGEGLGKSTVLLELKWKLQLARVPVVHVGAAQLGVDGEATLVHHLEVLGGVAPAGGGSLVDALRRSDREGWVLLIDDLDRTTGRVRRALSEALSGGPSGVQVVATGEARPEDMTPDLVLALSALDRTGLRALVQRTLGAVDVGVLDALWQRSGGNPGLLVEMLASLHGREGLGVTDVVELPVGRVGEHRVRARLQALSPDARRVLVGLALAGSLPEATVRAFLGAGGDAVIERLASDHAVAWDGLALHVPDALLCSYVRRRADDLDGPAIAAALLTEAEAGEASALAMARLADVAGDAEAFARHSLPAHRQAAAEGRLRDAAWVLERQLAYEGESTALHAALVEAYRGLGEHALLLDHAAAVLVDGSAPAESRACALLGAAHAHLLCGRREQAVQCLEQVPEDAPVDRRVDAHRELARILLRAHDDAGARRAAEAGLALPERPASSELHAVLGFVARVAGDEPGARACFEQAVRVARAADDGAAQARAQAYAALAAERVGRLEEAREAYRECLASARAVDDRSATATYALNLGNVSFRLGDLEAAREHYNLAHQWARRTGQGATEVFAKNNLAHLNLYLGLHAQAEGEASASLRVANNLDLAFGAAQARGILADLKCRRGALDEGVALYEQAAAELESMGRRRELAEVCLDHAGALLDAERHDRLGAVGELLDRARGILDDGVGGDFRPRLRWLDARRRLSAGEVGDAIESLVALEGEARDAGDRELLWGVLAALAEARRQSGESAEAGRALRAAAQVIDALAGSLPAEAREAFRAEPRRRRVLEAAGGQGASSSGSSGTGMGAQTTAFGDPRQLRLLELIKHLAREHDLDALLERITDAAIELSGAERGFVLLTGADGELQPHTLRERRTPADARRAAFSRSIAEAVLIDGEPIVTLDAQGDARVNEFMSVHQLHLRSVACLPICAADSTLGVLYLEHRLRPGRFREQDLDLLLAFADQAAIAIENARLWADLGAQKARLEHESRQLEEAKRDLEAALASRSEELAEVKQHLGQARQVLSRGSQRHGMVGRCEAMQRVFSLIDRVQGSSIPVVVVGESGTGKELVARAIHAGSPRSAGPFVAINCGALPESLLESELFGYRRGAFTGADRDRTGLLEQASGGTLFLDEFADVPMRMQVDLLRVLQERKVVPLGASEGREIDVRVVVATSRDLAELVEQKRVREDLFYRLNVVQVRLPSLRERRDDIPLLCDFLLGRLAREHGMERRTLSPSARRALVRADLPGNVRQLEHVLLSASLMTDAKVLEVGDLALGGSLPPPGGEGEGDGEQEDEPAPDSAHPPRAAGDLSGYRARERQQILDALESCGWNRVRAAEAVGMPRRTFYRRLKQYGIQ